MTSRSDNTRSDGKNGRTYAQPGRSAMSKILANRRGSLAAVTLSLCLLGVGCGSNKSTATSGGAHVVDDPSNIVTTVTLGVNEPSTTSIGDSLGATSTTSSLLSPISEVTTIPPPLPGFKSVPMPTAPPTTLSPGPAGPDADTVRGLPLRLALTSQQLLEAASAGDPIKVTFDVAVGAIITVVLDNALMKEIGATSPFATPTSENPSIIEPIVPRSTCALGMTCGTFAAVNVGPANIAAVGPSGNGITPAIFAFYINVH